MNHKFDIYKGTGWSTCQNSIWWDFPIFRRFRKCFCWNIPQQFAGTPENWEASWYRVELTSRTLHIKYWITNLAPIKEQDGLLIVPVKIRFDETSQFSEGSANNSVTTFLSLQKLPNIGRPHDITFWRVELTNRKPQIKYWITNLANIKEQDGLHVVPVKIRFDKTYQFAAGSANVSFTRFAERSENLEFFWHQILTGKTDRSETRTSKNESW